MLAVQIDQTTVAQPTINGTDAAEQRIAHRRRVYKGAMIKFDDGSSTMECVMRNENAEGALLSFGGLVLLPDQFSLIDKLTGNVHRAEIAWRKGLKIGVRYT